ncbi:MAG: hypothetical protein PHS92_01560 [Candidatus Gracilibacteria bacterium]|nr:hypothetical protein [Candidatus Gracilibacteria bacterium]
MGNKGNSIIEVVVVIVILTFGIVGTFSILNSSQILSTTTENKIKAINIARDGIESVINIRDTNWIKFSSDYSYCWFVKAYDVNCIGSTLATLKNYPTGDYAIEQIGSLLYLTGSTQFPVYYDANGLITQSGSFSTKCTSSLSTGCVSIFTRKIHIEVIDPLNEIKVSSIAEWRDSAKKNGPYRINLETTLTNWKTKF